MEILSAILQKLLYLSLLNGMFVVAILMFVVPLFMTRRAAYAVAKRNFVGYFSNPTGYVFICLFVVMCSLAAYWPVEFFQSNIATLHQLNFYLPAIMLIAIKVPRIHQTGDSAQTPLTFYTNAYSSRNDYEGF